MSSCWMQRANDDGYNMWSFCDYLTVYLLFLVTCGGIIGYILAGWLVSKIDQENVPSRFVRAAIEFFLVMGFLALELKLLSWTSVEYC